MSRPPIGENQGCDNQKQGCNKILQPVNATWFPPVISMYQLCYLEYSIIQPCDNIVILLEQLCDDIAKYLQGCSAISQDNNVITRMR